MDCCHARSTPNYSNNATATSSAGKSGTGCWAMPSWRHCCGGGGDHSFEAFVPLTLGSAFSPRGRDGCTTIAEADMSQRTFSLIASVVFGLIALGHVLRIVFNLSFVVQDISVPMWASGI